MFKIEDTTIKITRGDYGIIGVTAEDEDGTDYTFQVDDQVRFAIYEKKNYDSLILEKVITVTEPALEVDVEFTPEDTKIGETINKPTDYWYEISLNPDGNTQTIVGYDDTGAKIFRIYPEGVED
jgi:hypothetical protein